MLFRRLAVFAGGCTLEAADAVANAHGELDILEGLTALVAQSLIRRTEARGEPRFGMLETIREYALERLGADPDAGEAHRRHAEHFLALAEALRPQIEGANGPAVLAQFEIEHANLQAALSWAADRGDAEMGLRLVSGIWKFWWVHRHLAVGRDWIERIVALPGHVPPTLRIEARYAAGSMALGQRDYEAAWGHGEEGLALARHVNEAYFLPSMLFLLGNIARSRHDYDHAVALYEEALAFIRQRTTDHPLASHQKAMILASLGATHYGRGAYDQAESLIQEARVIWQERRDLWGLGIAAHDLARICAKQGRTEQAAALYRESISHHWDVGDTSGLGETIAGLASLCATRSDLAGAARLFGATAAVGETAGVPGAAMILGYDETVVGAVRSALGEEEFTRAWVAGRGLTMEEAIADAETVAQTLSHPAL
jgi:tetratricopeptide (TPR) repeat protein